MKKPYLAILTLLACLALLGQQVQYSMQEGPYYKNVPFVFQLALQDTKPDTQPEMPESADFSVQALPPQSSSNSSVTIINGKYTKTESVRTLYNFRLTPRRTGVLTLPVCTVTIDGTRKSTGRQTRITVAELDTNNKLTLTAQADKAVCALGEAVTISFLLTSRANIQIYELDIPLLTLENADVTPVPLTERQANSRGALTLSAGGVSIPAIQSASSSQLAIRFAITLVPRKPGQITIRPASLVGQLVDTSRPLQRRNSFFDDPFFGGPRYATVRCMAETQPLTLTVKEPPAASRPASYTGLAEPCVISATADKQDVYVGDPIILSITIKGPKFPKSVICPQLGRNPAFNGPFRVFDNDAPGIINADSSVTFQRTIRATGTDVTAIPPIEISWFDAKDDTYRSSATQPIPITVKATKKATAISAVADVALDAAQIDVTASGTGLRGNFPPEECLRNQFREKASLVDGISVAILAAMPALAILIALATAVIRHRNANSDYYRARGAARKAIRILDKADDNTAWQAAIDALCIFAADKTHSKADAFTLQDVENLLRARECSPDQLERTRAIFRKCEDALYSKKLPCKPEDILSDTRHLLVELEKAIG